jgi:hypothetical protein
MTDLAKLVKATFPGPIITHVRGDANEQTVITCRYRGGPEEAWGVLSAGESTQIYNPIPGEVITIEAESLDDTFEEEDEYGEII